MKNPKYILHSVAVLAVVALATACSSEDGLADKTFDAEKVITITAHQPNTRVGFDKDGNGYWQAGDTIGVNVSLNGDDKIIPFSITDGVGESSATFSGTAVDGTALWAFYPYNARHLRSGYLFYYLPGSYDYTSVDQTFFPSGKDGNSFRMPMIGKITNNEVLFENIGGVVCLKIDKMPAESGTVVVSAATDFLLYGRFLTLNCEDLSLMRGPDSRSGNTVKFTYSNAVKYDVGIFYLPVIPTFMLTDYGKKPASYDLTVQVFGGNKVSTTKVAVDVNRSELKVVNIKTDYTDHSKTIDGHNFIDLGLPSGLLWAETNVGATTDTDGGNYYAWGETSPKEVYLESNYKYYDTSRDSLTKYYSTDEFFTGNLEPSDDAAYVNWGSYCRMPTPEEFSELMDSENSTCTWVSRMNSAGQTMNYMKVVSKKNKNVIYLPASGERNDMYSTGPFFFGNIGCFWTSTYRYKDKPDYACVSSSDGLVTTTDISRFKGRTIRPVAEP